MGDCDYEVFFEEAREKYHTAEHDLIRATQEVALSEYLLRNPDITGSAELRSKLILEERVKLCKDARAMVGERLNIYKSYLSEPINKMRRR